MRPKGWLNPHGTKEERDSLIGEEKFCYDAYEAGADAYEEGIWQMARESPTGIFLFDSKRGEDES